MFIPIREIADAVVILSTKVEAVDRKVDQLADKLSEVLDFLRREKEAAAAPQEEGLPVSRLTRTRWKVPAKGKAGSRKVADPSEEEGGASEEEGDKEGDKVVEDKEEDKEEVEEEEDKAKESTDSEWQRPEAEGSEEEKEKE